MRSACQTKETAHLKRLICGTYSTEDAPLPVVVGAAPEGWRTPCARCGGIHLAPSVWFPLVAHCPSGFREKNIFVIFPSVLSSQLSMKHNAAWGLLGIWYCLGPLIRSVVRVTEDKQMSVMSPSTSEIWLVPHFHLSKGHCQVWGLIICFPKDWMNPGCSDLDKMNAMFL